MGPTVGTETTETSNSIPGDNPAPILGLRCGPGIESRWAARFSAPVQTGPGVHPASYTLGTGSLPVVKRPGCDDDNSTSSAEVKERVQPYLYSPYVFMACSRLTFTFILRSSRSQ